MWRVKNNPQLAELEALWPGFGEYWDGIIEKFLNNMVQATELTASSLVLDIKSRFLGVDSEVLNQLLSWILMEIAGDYLRDEAKKKNAEGNKNGERVGILMESKKTIVSLLEELLRDFIGDKEGSKPTVILCPSKLYNLLLIEAPLSLNPEKIRLLGMLKEVLREECADLLGFEKSGFLCGIPIYFLTELEYIVFIDVEGSKIFSLHQEEFIRRIPYLEGRREK